MGFLDQIFGKKESEDQAPNLWRNITSDKDVDDAVAESYHRKVLIFKHSTRCFISKTVLKNFEKEIRDSHQDYAYYLLDLLAHRAISDTIASRFDVVHQSPQLIVLENGKVVHSASHQGISLD